LGDTLRVVSAGGLAPNSLRFKITLEPGWRIDKKYDASKGFTEFIGPHGTPMIISCILDKDHNLMSLRAQDLGSDPIGAPLHPEQIKNLSVNGWNGQMNVVATPPGDGHAGMSIISAYLINNDSLIQASCTEHKKVVDVLWLQSFERMVRSIKVDDAAK
jgi:hypothetical protein